MTRQPISKSKKAVNAQNGVAKYQGREIKQDTHYGIQK